MTWRAIEGTDEGDLGPTGDRDRTTHEDDPSSRFASGTQCMVDAIMARLRARRAAE